MIDLKKVVIPVAGLGTRMLPETKVIPKEMLPNIDKPIIQYVIEEVINGEKVTLEETGLSKREWNELMSAFNLSDKLI